MTFKRSIWYNQDNDTVEAVDQRALPFESKVFPLTDLEATAFAIREMVVRGAPLIGVTAAYGMAIGVRGGHSPRECADILVQTRPTAVNLKWALERQLALAEKTGETSVELSAVLLEEAHIIAAEDIDMCSRIGDHGITLIIDLHDRKQDTVNILTHCNAGWLATVQWGTATAPIYKAHAAGIPVHVWVDETRPRNQGARLTSWELTQAGIPHHVITDNAGGHLMQHGQVDIVITGSDRTTGHGDVCNKIGTYLKALAARDNDIPYYAALPLSTIDWDMGNGLEEVPIEERDGDEVTSMDVLTASGVQRADMMPAATPVRNYAFDVTPARLVTGIITERGIAEASPQGLRRLYDR